MPLFLEIFFICQFLLSQNSMFHVQFSWVKILYFFSLCTILSKTHIVLHTHTHTQNKNNNLGLKHFSSFMFEVVQNSFLNFKKSSNFSLNILEKSKYVIFLFSQLNPNKNCRVMICSPSPKDLGYEPNEPNTINL